MSLIGMAMDLPAAGAAGVSGNNHGSADVVRDAHPPTTAALLQSAGGAMMTAPPAGMVGAATATEQARARGQQRLDDHLKTQAHEAPTEDAQQATSVARIPADFSTRCINFQERLRFQPDGHA